MYFLTKLVFYIVFFQVSANIGPLMHNQPFLGWKCHPKVEQSFPRNSFITINIITSVYAGTILVGLISIDIWVSVLFPFDYVFSSLRRWRRFTLNFYLNYRQESNNILKLSLEELAYFSKKCLCIKWKKCRSGELGRSKFLEGGFWLRSHA